MTILRGALAFALSLVVPVPPRGTYHHPVPVAPAVRLGPAAT